MPVIVKFLNGNLNLSLLNEELATVGLVEHGLLIAGFRSVGNQQYRPFTERQVISTRTGPGGITIVDEADPGELRFDYDPPLTPAREAALDAVLAAHDATGVSREQIGRSRDAENVLTLAENYRNWGGLTPVQKDENNRVMTRLVARLQDRSLDL